MAALREQDVLAWLHSRISAADWRILGTNLGLDGHRLRQIRADHQDVENKLWMVVHYWLREAYDTKTYGHPSWARLEEAVDAIISDNKPQR